MTTHFCLFPNCETLLSHKRKFCFLHTRIIKQNAVVYQKGRFYQWKYSQGSKGKDNKTKVNNIFLKNLKEILADEV